MPQSRISVMTPGLILFGVIVLAVLPPLGVLCLLGAVVVQAVKSYQRRTQIRQAGYAIAEREERERILAYKALR